MMDTTPLLPLLALLALPLAPHIRRWSPGEYEQYRKGILIVGIAGFFLLLTPLLSFSIPLFILALVSAWFLRFSSLSWLLLGTAGAVVPQGFMLAWSFGLAVECLVMGVSFRQNQIAARMLLFLALYLPLGLL